MRILGWTMTFAAALVAGVLLVFKLFPETQRWHVLTVYASSFIPFLWLPGLVLGLGLVLLLHRRRRLFGGLVLAVVVAVWVPPLLGANGQGGQHRSTPGIVVLSHNLQFGRAALPELQQLIEGSDADVLAFQEYTPDFEERLAAAGLLERYPHKVGSARADAGGTMLLSRTPLEIVGEAGTVFHNFVATTTIRGTNWHLGAIHATPPQMGAELWAEDGDRVARLAARFVDRRLVMVGDFNAIEEHLPMRQLVGLGLRPSGDWVPSWPVGHRVPPFVHIDHALVSDAVLGREPSYASVTGSDHKALVVVADAA